MIRVTPTKILLKADDSQEYEVHKASWKVSGTEKSNTKSNSKITEEQDELQSSRRTAIGLFILNLSGLLL